MEINTDDLDKFFSEKTQLKMLKVVTLLVQENIWIL